jgi:hypothetical protein
VAAIIIPVKKIQSAASLPLEVHFSEGDDRKTVYPTHTIRKAINGTRIGRRNVRGRSADTKRGRCCEAIRDW